MFGPKPATHDHCTLGGMIGNNSCGATAQAYGKTVDNVVRLEVLTYDGRGCGSADLRRRGYERILATAAGGPRSTGRCGSCATRTPTQIRAGSPDIPRRVSGYNLDSLLPEKRLSTSRRALVGSEGTLRHGAATPS